MAQITQATTKLLKFKKRIRAVCGGTSASKTYSIIMILIDYAQTNKNKRIDVISESYPHLEDGAIKDFMEIMQEQGYWEDKRWNSSKHFYNFGDGTVLKFKSVDKLGKAKGPRRDVLFLNEANHIAHNIYDQLEPRTKEIVWLDWNPSNEFWYYEHIKDKVDHDFITLTYKDCLEALDPRIVESIESRKANKSWWQVYGLGQLGEVEGKIYKGWKIIDEIPHEARLERYGMDMGFSCDPTAIIAIYYYNGGYILDEVLCRRGMLNKDIADHLKNLKQALVVADSAEPKSIEEIRQYGINIVGARKQSESVGKFQNYNKWAIGVVQEQQISMTKQSINLIKAYRNYLWKTDKEGNILNEPDHYLSDCMDAVKYGMISLAPVINRQQMWEGMTKRRLTRSDKKVNPAR